MMSWELGLKPALHEHFLLNRVYVCGVQGRRVRVGAGLTVQQNRVVEGVHGALRGTPLGCHQWEDCDEEAQHLHFDSNYYYSTQQDIAPYFRQEQHRVNAHAPNTSTEVGLAVH
jgi:hypothetical protein